MIAINLHTKRIRIRSALAAPIDERDTYIELSQLWRKSPWLPGNEPFGFNVIDRTIFVSEGWVLLQTNAYGETVRSIW